MQKVKNKDGKGNPYHDEEGKFTSSGESGQKNSPESALEMPEDIVSGEKVEISEPKKEESSILTIKPFNPYDLDMVLASFDSTNQEIEEVLTKSANFAELLNVKGASQLTLEDKKTYLEMPANELDLEKLKDADEQTINALFMAGQIKKAQKLVQQKLVLLDEEKAHLAHKETKDVEDALKEATNDKEDLDLSGMWLGFNPTLEDYEELSKVDEDGTSRISRKRDYFKEQIEVFNGQIETDQAIADDMFSMVDEVEAAQKNIEKFKGYIANYEKKIENLDRFEKYGQIYKQIKQEVAQRYVEQYEKLEKEYIEAKETQKEVNSPAYFELVGVSNKLISKFQNESAIYSQVRKDNAVWFKGDNVIKQAEKHLFPTAEKHYSSMTSAEIKMVDRYKSGSSAFNEPLRQITYTGGKSFYGQTYSEAINNLTNAIDKCEWPDDIWVQRGQSASLNVFEINGVKKSIINMTDDERNSLVGSMYIDNGFYSAGAGKGTGFSNFDLIINTYCPKGTKMVYAQYRPGYKSENEMILQRGYTYRITKVEKKGSQYYMDVEVMLNSDQNKPIGSDLENIANKLYKGN